jgi:hypothetical protein
LIATTLAWPDEGFGPDAGGPRGAAGKAARELIEAERLERVKGIEPSSEAWEADFRPLILKDFFNDPFRFSVLLLLHFSPSFPHIPSPRAIPCHLQRCEPGGGR